MKTFWKTTILIAFLSLLFGSIKAQGGDFPPQRPVENQVKLSFEWQQMGERCNGCLSILVSVHKEAKADDEGRYWSYVYAMSSSLDSVGHPMVTKIVNLSLYGTDMLGNRNFSPISTMPAAAIGPPIKSFNGWNLLFSVWSTAPDQKYIFEFESLEEL